MQRDEMIEKLQGASSIWDVAVIGGGATGLGVAVDAASRGYSTILLEQSDFAKGTSSRSTKLVHGGVRYLQQGNLSLVLEALRERGILHQNAPHLVKNLSFVVPIYDWWEGPFYGVGLKLYDAMAGKQGFGRSRWLSKAETREQIPTIRTDGLRGGVRYFDGQFDDARLAITLALTAADLGAVVVNYARVIGLEKSGGAVAGVTLRDELTGATHRVGAKVVVNATGPFTDEVRALDDPELTPMIKPSRGVHLVLDRSFLPKDSAILVPHTSDGRVLFAVPWHDRVLVGTTDTPVDEISLEPTASADEVEFLLANVSRYLVREPHAQDVLSIYAGIRPLVDFGRGELTASVSREHTIHISRSGLVSVAGGKWTTYRKMAEDTVDQVRALGELADVASATRELRLHGFDPNARGTGPFGAYGSDATLIHSLIHEESQLGVRVHPELPPLRAEVVWAARHEMAMTVEDFLARRTRCLLLDAARSVEAAPVVAELLARELGRDRAWRDRQITEFEALARRYAAAPAR